LKIDVIPDNTDFQAFSAYRISNANSLQDKYLAKSGYERNVSFPQCSGCKRRFFAPDKEKCVAFLRAQKNVVE
jgi:hypothetical protein